MKRSLFQYDLPPEQIAQFPLAERSASRLLVMSKASGAVSDRVFSDLPDLLREGDLLVANNTRVLPARLHARKDTGGRVEILLERLTGENACIAQLRASKSPGPGTGLLLEDGSRLTVTGRQDDFFVLESGNVAMADLMSRCGHMPLPPYIAREDEAADRERYQTVYARVPGAVAAPTAGLHFDADLLSALNGRGVETAELTLHVGAGTFQPVRVDEIEDHRMHAEYLEVSEACCQAVESARQRGGRVIAVGTTAVRSLETAAANGQLEPWNGDSRLFIYPGYRFRAIDGMITNFHLPESTLLMLVCAFAGMEPVLSAYRHAVAGGYRFFSYGDAMLVA